MYCSYPKLFQIVSDPSISVFYAFHNSTLTLSFNRQLTGIYLNEWLSLYSTITYDKVFFDLSKPDYISWRWGPCGKFTVHSLYLWIVNRGIPNTTYDTLWNSNIPLKIKVFMWLVMQDKILTKENLLNKGWQGDISCPFCGVFETTDHLFVICPIATSLWT